MYPVHTQPVMGNPVKHGVVVSRVLVVKYDIDLNEAAHDEDAPFVVVLFLH